MVWPVTTWWRDTSVFHRWKLDVFHQNDPTFLASRDWSVEKPPRCELIDCKSETACAWIIWVIGIIPKNFQILKLWIFGRFKVAYIGGRLTISEALELKPFWKLMSSWLHGGTAIKNKLVNMNFCQTCSVTHATSAQRVAVTQYLGAL